MFPSVRASLFSLLVCISAVVPFAANAQTIDQPLPGTEPLTIKGDIASLMIEGIDRFLLSETRHVFDHRMARWAGTADETRTHEKTVAEKRDRLSRMLGIRDARVPGAPPTLVHRLGQDPVVATGDGFEIVRVRWKAFGEVSGCGLLLKPTRDIPVGNVIALPDADQTPEMLVGLEPSDAPSSPYPLVLAQHGYRVLIPLLISREMQRHRGANLTHREFLYRPAFEMGRHIIGYELQKIFAALDWFDDGGPLATGIVGWGEGGLLALYAAALDPRIDAALVSGYFRSRERLWTEPIDRNVFGLLEEFGDAEVAAMIAPRALLIEASRFPQVIIPGEGGAPGSITTPPIKEVLLEADRARALCERLGVEWQIEIANESEPRIPLADRTIDRFQVMIGQRIELDHAVNKIDIRDGYGADQESRMADQIAELDRHNQRLLAESPHVREQFFSDLDTSSLDAFVRSAGAYREYFYDKVIGRFDRPLLAPRPRSRIYMDTERWRAYEVVMDVFPDVFAYGILLVPKGLEKGERRPVVVCQHGLEGRPQDVISGDHRAYHDFAATLADQGFVTFAPQNIYIFGDRFRTLQRKANPIGKTLFSIMVPQHQQIVNWLSSLDFVDADRIGFYGLSYGGKSAMRIPPLVPQYALSICSADFNDWIWKNASSRSKYSYVGTGEYEIFEFDLGSTFNYSDMAALIAPRPFMVERGHHDGVAPDYAVGAEFARVRELYAARLKIPDRCEIEWFDGPHTIHGVGTFEFLRHHLDWTEATR